MDGSRQLEQNLIGAMPWIVTSAEPMLTAACVQPGPPQQLPLDDAIRMMEEEEEAYLHLPY